MPAAPAVILRAVETPADLEILRQVRNSCRKFMTRDTLYIRKERQVRWWRRVDRTRLHVYLLEDTDRVFGYGLALLILNMRHVWLSGGLFPEYRGKGYGKALFEALLAFYPEEAWLEVQRENASARRLYEGLGFRIVSETPDVITMVLYRGG